MQSIRGRLNLQRGKNVQYMLEMDSIANGSLPLISCVPDHTSVAIAR